MLPSDGDYILFARSVYGEHHLRSSINFAMHKTKAGALTEGIVKNNLKGTIERFIARDNAFSFMVKGTPAYWKQFLYNVLNMVKKLGIPTYFLTYFLTQYLWQGISSINLKYFWIKLYLMIHWEKQRTMLCDGISRTG